MMMEGQRRGAEAGARGGGRDPFCHQPLAMRCSGRSSVSGAAAKHSSVRLLRRHAALSTRADRSIRAAPCIPGGSRTRSVGFPAGALPLQPAGIAVPRESHARSTSAGGCRLLRRRPRRGTALAARSRALPARVPRQPCRPLARPLRCPGTPRVPSARPTPSPRGGPAHRLRLRGDALVRGARARRPPHPSTADDRNGRAPAPALSASSAARPTRPFPPARPLLVQFTALLLSQ
jgi:hypothetical protein